MYLPLSLERGLLEYIEDGAIFNNRKLQSLFYYVIMLTFLIDIDILVEMEWAFT